MKITTTPYLGMRGWVSRNLAKWQLDRKLTNPQAAKELGVPLRTYGDWKGGQHAPRGFALKQLNEKLKASARHSNAPAHRPAREKE